MSKAPIITASADPFEGLRRRLAGKSNTAALAAAIAELAKIKDSLQARHAELSQQREATLLTADADMLAKSRAALGAIGDQLEVAAAFRTKLAADHTAALAAEDQVRRRDTYDAATAKIAAAKTFSRDFDRAARAMASAMSILMEAKLAATDANEFLPAGAEPIPDPEWALGCTLGEAKKILKEEAVELWCLLDTWTPIAGQDRVVTGGTKPNRGYSPPGGDGAVGNVEVEKRSFLRREILPQTNAVWADPVSQTLCIPGWITPPMRGPFPLEPAGYLATIAAMVTSHDAAPAPAAKRKAELEIVPVTDDGEVREDQATRGVHVEAVALTAKPQRAA